jgi:hypothetical protein
MTADGRGHEALLRHSARVGLFFSRSILALTVVDRGNPGISGIPPWERVLLLIPRRSRFGKAAGFWRNRPPFVQPTHPRGLALPQKKRTHCQDQHDRLHFVTLGERQSRRPCTSSGRWLSEGNSPSTRRPPTGPNPCDDPGLPVAVVRTRPGTSRRDYLGEEIAWPIRSGADA